MWLPLSDMPFSLISRRARIGSVRLNPCLCHALRRYQVHSAATNSRFETHGTSGSGTRAIHNSSLRNPRSKCDTQVLARHFFEACPGEEKSLLSSNALEVLPMDSFEVPLRNIEPMIEPDLRLPMTVCDRYQSLTPCYAVGAKFRRVPHIKREYSRFYLC